MEARREINEGRLMNSEQELQKEVNAREKQIDILLKETDNELKLIMQQLLRKKLLEERYIFLKGEKERLARERLR